MLFLEYKFAAIFLCLPVFPSICLSLTLYLYMYIFNGNTDFPENKNLGAQQLGKNVMITVFWYMEGLLSVEIHSFY